MTHEYMITIFAVFDVCSRIICPRRSKSGDSQWEAAAAFDEADLAFDWLSARIERTLTKPNERRRRRRQTPAKAATATDRGRSCGGDERNVLAKISAVERR
jgi:hypothetical protein